MSLDRAPLVAHGDGEPPDRAPPGSMEASASHDAASGVRVVKHSIAIAGHRTSISLEDAFWRALKDIAAREGVSLAALVARIDSRRGAANLSSALRVFVLEHVGRRNIHDAALPR